MIFRIFVILIFFTISGVASANKFDSTFKGGVDTTINNIVSGGSWKHGETYGRWRLIVRNLGWEHTRSFLYLQWLQTDDDKKDVIELQTIPITEFNEGKWRNVGRVEYIDNSFSIYYTVRAQDGKQKATLTPAFPGNYKISF